MCVPSSGLDSRFAWLFKPDATRLVVLEEGIVVDRCCEPVAVQLQEYQIRDTAAAPYLNSTDAAIREATRHHSKGVMLTRAAEFLESLPKRSSSVRVVVDLGCGFGWHWIELAQRFTDVLFVLIDFSLVNLRVCRNLMPPSRWPNVLCLKASVMDVPLQNDVATAVWSVQVLQHLVLNDRSRALAEMERILGSPGSFYLAWVRPVPFVRVVYRLFGRHYHIAGNTSYGLYLDRFDDSTHGELRRVFPSGRVTFSEALFHPEMRIRPRSRWIGDLDRMVSSTPVAPFVSRQAEFSGQR